MDIFFKSTACILIAVILTITISKHNKDISLLLVIAVSCMISVIAVKQLSPVFDFFKELQTLGKLDSQMIGILMKSVGIGMIAEIAGLICEDAGNAALGKTLKYLATAVILCISLPLFTSLLELIEEMLVAV